MRNSALVVLILLLFIFSCVSEPAVQQDEIEPVVENDIPVDQGPVKDSLKITPLSVDIQTDRGFAHTSFLFKESLFATSYSSDENELIVNKSDSSFTEFTELQRIQIDSPEKIIDFIYDNEQYLLVLQTKSDSILYKFDGKQFNEFQVFEQKAFHGAGHFTDFQDDIFLIFGNSYDDYGHNLDSTVYKFGEVAFRPYQSIMSFGASYIDTAVFDNNLWLIISGQQDESTLTLMQFDETAFTEVASIENTALIKSQLYIMDDALQIITANSEGIKNYEFSDEELNQKFEKKIANLRDFTFYRSSTGATYLLTLSEYSLSVYQFESNGLKKIDHISTYTDIPLKVVSIDGTDTVEVLFENNIQFYTIK